MGEVACPSSAVFGHIVELRKEIDRLSNACEEPFLPPEIYALIAETREALDQAATLPVQSAADAIGALGLLREELSDPYTQIADRVISYLKESSGVP